MNISKAKAVMIVVFAALNIFLAYQLLAPRWEGMRVAVTREEVQSMEEEILEYNYTADVSVPRNIRTSSFLTVKAPLVNPEEVKRDFLKGQEIDTIDLDDKLIYKTEGAYLEIYQNGYFRYQHKDIPETEEKENRELPDKQEAEALAGKFLQERGIEVDRPDESRMDVSANTVKLTYYGEHLQIPLFSCYINVTIEEGVVSEVESYRLRIVGMEERREMEVIPATVAVLRLLEDIGPADGKKSITNLDLGFYSREYDAEQWEIPPVWRIIIDNEAVYYINAFTGNIEAEVTR